MNNNLREKYKSFVFENYSITKNEKGLFTEFVYKIDEFEFKPTLFIDKKDITNDNIDDTLLEKLIFNFGIINGINYYKLTCSRQYTIKCGYLDYEQKEFFKKLFYNGLAELLYKNELDIAYEDFLQIETSGEEILSTEIVDNFDGNLIPVGGGKDSIVTLELLNVEREKNKIFQYKRDIYPEDIASKNTVLTAGYSMNDVTSFNITLDKLMLELNKQGFYNGHVPLSSCLAFAALIMAYLNNKKYIVLSNEASANESNVSGKNINHQYSKSYEFEKDFREYTKNYLIPHIEYFSLLRCWNEFQIVKEFLKTPKYLEVFRSCNIGAKKNIWCADCPKCLYVTIMLYPFIGSKGIIDIFGVDMLDNIKYKDVLIGLISTQFDKPFECVGTKEEIDYALKLCIEKYNNLPVLLEFYKTNYYDETKKYDVETYFNKENFINEKFLKLIGNDNNEK